VPDILPRRRVLAASAAALPTLLVTAACQSSEVFAGPDPLVGRPTLAPDVITLQAVIAAEQALIALYQDAVHGDLRMTLPPAGRASLLEGLLAQHRQHLGQLQARLVLPPGTPSPQASASVSASGSAAGRVTIARLRAAERASAADLVRRLVTMPPALAQLLASIAASDATHVVALGG
jgi:hypothetical protein